MTDDEILTAAERIKARREAQRQLDAFERSPRVMIRWDVPYSSGQASFCSIQVTPAQVAKLVRAHYAPLLSKRRRAKA